MRSDAIAFGIAGVCFGLIAGWVIGSQQAASRPAAAVAASAPAGNAAGDAAGGSGTRAAILDETHVTALKSVADRQPQNPKPRIELANVDFHADRADDAITSSVDPLPLAPTHL